MTGLNIASMGVIFAPWTDAEVNTLNQWQALAWVHPFKCRWPHRRDSKLVAMNDGWHCPRCKFVQLWAHDFQINLETLPSIRMYPQREPGPES